MKSICIYCTRTGKSKIIAENIASKKDIELLQITDGKDRKGFWGYISTMLQQLRGKNPELLPVKTQFPLAEYEKIIFVFPIWCEDVCILTKSFLSRYGKELNGEVYFIATHMSNIPYSKKIAALDSYGKKASGYFSVCSKNDSFEKSVEEYVDSIIKHKTVCASKCNKPQDLKINNA